MHVCVFVGVVWFWFLCVCFVLSVTAKVVSCDVTVWEKEAAFMQCPFSLLLQAGTKPDPTSKNRFTSFFKNLVVELDKDAYGPDNHLAEWHRDQKTEDNDGFTVSVYVSVCMCECVSVCVCD